MNCRKFALFVIDLARDHVPTSTAHRQALQHAEGCAACKARLVQERALYASMRLVVEDIAQQAAPAYLEANLLAALQEHTTRQPSTSLPVVATRWWSWQFATVAVAALLLVILLVAGRSFQHKEQKQAVQPLPVQSDIPAPPSLMVKGGSTVAATAPRQTQAVARRGPSRRPAPPSPTPAPAETMPFYSLVEEGAVAPLESGRVVRVEVPAATLIPYGVPLTAEAMSQPVQADLLVGQDGLARAIRFVPAGQNPKTQ